MSELENHHDTETRHEPDSPATAPTPSPGDGSTLTHWSDVRGDPAERELMLLEQLEDDCAVNFYARTRTAVRSEIEDAGLADELESFVGGWTSRLLTEQVEDLDGEPNRTAGALRMCAARLGELVTAAAGALDGAGAGGVFAGPEGPLRLAGLVVRCVLTFRLEQDGAAAERRYLRHEVARLRAVVGPERTVVLPLSAWRDDDEDGSAAAAEPGGSAAGCGNDTNGGEDDPPVWGA